MQRQRGDGTLALRVQVCGHAHGEVGQRARRERFGGDGRERIIVRASDEERAAAG
jgi:hypothetical protein